MLSDFVRKMGTHSWDVRVFGNRPCKAWLALSIVMKAVTCEK